MIDEQFYRQRRNLMLMSLLIIFFNTTAGKIEKINVLGTELAFQNPNSLPWILGVILFYYLIRYAQYAHEIENKGFKDRWLKRADGYLAIKLLERELKKEKSQVRLTYPDLKQIKIEQFMMYRGGQQKNTAFSTYCGKDGGLVIESNGVPVTKTDQIMPFIRAAIYIMLRTRLVTDYALPVVLAMIAFLTYWSGTTSLWMVHSKNQ